MLGRGVELNQRGALNGVGQGCLGRGRLGRCHGGLSRGNGLRGSLVGGLCGNVCGDGGHGNHRGGGSHLGHNLLGHNLIGYDGLRGRLLNRGGCLCGRSHLSYGVQHLLGQSGFLKRNRG